MFMVLRFLLLIISLNLYANPIADQISVEIFSPYCPGRSLRDCPSSSADLLKKEILQEANSGKSKEEILNGLEERFGKEILSFPKSKSNKILLWITPGIFVLIGILTIFLSVKKSKNN